MLRWNIPGEAVGVAGGGYGGPMSSSPPERRCEDLCSRQYGAIAREQTLASGMRPSAIHARVRSGAWLRVHPRVYRPRGVPVSWRGELMAGLLWAGPASFASHRSAARLHGLDGTEAAPIEISLWTGRCRPGVVSTDCGRPTGLRLGARRRAQAPRVGEVLDEALRRGLTTLPRLRRSLEAERAPGRDGWPASRRCSRSGRGPIPASRASWSAACSLLQHEVRSRRRLVARLDFAYPELRLGIETHGYRWHGGARRWRRDIARENALRRLGWVVFVFTWDDVVGGPDRVVKELREALASRASGTGKRRAQVDRTRAG